MKYDHHNLVYFTKDLIERDDFTNSKRYLHYTKLNTNSIFLNLINLDDKITNVPIFDTQTAKDSSEAESIIQEILNLVDSNSNVPYADSEIQRENVICSLLGIERRPELFKQIIEQVSPFILICPEGKKCEWIDIVKKECIDSNNCVGCVECVLIKEGKEDEIDTQKKCCYHEQTYETQDDNCVWEILESFKAIFFNCVLHGRRMGDYLEIFSKIVGKIPIFEYSSAIDILRWHTFNEAIKQFHESITSRELALKNSLAKGLEDLQR